MNFYNKKYIGTQGEVCRQLKLFQPHGCLCYWPFLGGGPGLFLFYVALWFLY